MRVEVITQSSPHLAKVKRLGRDNAATLGFFPEGAFDEYASKKNIFVAIDDAGECVGYLAYRITGGRAVIVHLCVAQRARNKGVARRLVENLKGSTQDLFGIGLKCRRDYEASKVWSRLGFVARCEVAGRGKEGKPLTSWWLDHGYPNLFTSCADEESGSKVLAATDANVFYDLLYPDRPGYEESNSLTADWLPKKIELCVTEELFNEINRGSEQSQRECARDKAKTFPCPPCNVDDMNRIRNGLRHLFPSEMSDRDESDLRQVARAVAANIAFFVTRDDRLLRIAEDVYDLYKITIIRPSEFIIRLDELSGNEEYHPARLAGTLLKSSLVRNGDESALTRAFLSGALGEKKYDFERRLRNILANANESRCYSVSDKEGKLLAIIAYRRRDHELEIPLVRVRKGLLASTLARYLVSQVVKTAAAERRRTTRITDNFIEDHVDGALATEGFVRGESQSIKVNIVTCATADELRTELARVTLTDPVHSRYYAGVADVLGKPSVSKDALTALGVEKLLSPAKLVDADIPTFIVSIRPQWAKDLFDENLANQTLFGADSLLALNCESVYYSAANPVRRLCGAGRILWYISQGKGRSFSGTKYLRACSRLDEVVVGRPKDLYHRFRRLGVYEWRHVYETADKNIDKKIMALKFSGTEMFTHPVSWRTMQDVLTRHDVRTTLVSPTLIPPAAFANLYSLGFGQQTANGNLG